MAREVRDIGNEERSYLGPGKLAVDFEAEREGLAPLARRLDVLDCLRRAIGWIAIGFCVYVRTKLRVVAVLVEVGALVRMRVSA